VIKLERDVDFDTIDRSIADVVVDVPVRIRTDQDNSERTIAVAAIAAVSARKIVLPRDADVQPA